MSDDAEKEASEVLHSLLSVERIEHKATSNNTNTSGRTNQLKFDIFQKKVNRSQKIDKHELVSQINWQYNNEEVNGKEINNPDFHDIEQSEQICTTTNTQQFEIVDVESSDTHDFLDIEEIDYAQPKDVIPDEKFSKKISSDTQPDQDNVSLAEVRERFRQGCECKESCFKNLKADYVYKHRLNVAELTKEEHDMYLMGVTMACLANPNQTYRNKERQRQRASYVYQGRRVCLDAFLYLENVTQYHIKRIRNHIMNHGVTPRVHGNMGKKPHNTFSLDIYKYAEHFVKELLQKHKTDGTKPFVLSGESRSSIYNKFKQSALHPDGKIMGYSTFRHFMKKQFPNVRFNSQKLEHISGKTVGIKESSHVREKTPKKSAKKQEQITKTTNDQIQDLNQTRYAVSTDDQPYQQSEIVINRQNILTNVTQQYIVDQGGGGNFTDSLGKKIQTAYFLTPITINSADGVIQTTNGDDTKPFLLAGDLLNFK